jgi:hypothetical protein
VGLVPWEEVLGEPVEEQLLDLGREKQSNMKFLVVLAVA